MIRFEFNFFLHILRVTILKGWGGILSYLQKLKVKVYKIRAILLFSMAVVLFSFSIRASEELISDYTLILENKKSASLPLISPKESDLAKTIKKEEICCFISCFSWLFLKKKSITPLKNKIEENQHLTIDISMSFNPAGKHLNFPTNVNLIIANFLDFADQLKLSHVNKAFRSDLNEEFWEKQIVGEKYLIWNDYLPRAKVFFANYFYQKGFGRDPMLSERVVSRIEDVSPLPSFTLAERSLTLGFPKGKENYRQASHKMIMLKISHENKENEFSRSYNYYPDSCKLLLSYQSFYGESLC